MNTHIDGVDHINIYSSGKTWLGRTLSNFAYTPFECEDGAFNSIEGYWYWLSCRTDDPEREQLRELAGVNAKNLGKRLCRGGSRNDPLFKAKICEALKIKIETYPSLREGLLRNKLPFEHYYVFDDVCHYPRGSEWVVEFIAGYAHGLTV